MQTLRIPTPLRAYVDGRSEVTVNGRTIAEAMQDLTSRYPDLRPHLFNEEGNLRPFVNLFLNQEDIRSLQGLETPIMDDDRLMIVPSIAGG